jgi:hypothetical protein
MRNARRRYSRVPGLLLLSATGPDTAAKSLRATLYQPELAVEFRLSGLDAGCVDMCRACLNDKPVLYSAALAKLAPGVIHLVAAAHLPGLLTNMSDDHLWGELSGPRYTTPLLRAWVPWLRKTLAQHGEIIVADGYQSQAGVLKADNDALDEIVSGGVRSDELQMC